MHGSVNLLKILLNNLIFSFFNNLTAWKKNEKKTLEKIGECRDHITSTVCEGEGQDFWFTIALG